uniref:AIR synthase n=1 Tax=candidate division WOR-3 bacterium TaxID=2052148 RepID=A0A7C6AAD3_UNCW3
MLPAIGKLDRESFEKIIFPYLGKPNKNVLVGPKHGVDAAVIDLGDRVMAVATDPTFGMPVVMPFFGWAIAHICASDVAVLGIKTEYMTICILLTPESKPETLEGFWKKLNIECKKLDITIVGGHTGIYPGISYPLNGGCTVWGFGKKEDLTPASNAKIGDKVIITKGPAIEAVGILALQAEAKLTEKFGREIVAKAKNRLIEMTVVKDALIAAKFANALHDATEGGLLNGVYEIAESSGTGVRIDEDKIVIPEEIAKVCDYFSIDPLISISEGTLVITAEKAKAPKLISELERNGIPAYEIGEITEGERVFVRKDKREEKLVPVKVDPFWQAYFSTLQ